MGSSRKAREYCCCAIPLVNAGIYSALTFQAIVGSAIGLVSITTPRIVGAHTPAIASWIFAIICFLGAAAQLLGFMGVKQEKPALFHRYAGLHLLINVAAFIVAGVWITLSGIGHRAAVAACDTEFFANGSAPVTSEGALLCEIFPWVDLGIMGALFFIILIAQIYFYVLISGYGSMQRTDHKRFDSVYDASKPLTSDIGGGFKDAEPFTDKRPSVDNGHGRQDSIDSVMSVPQQQPNYGGQGGYGGYDPRQVAYPPQRQPTRQPTRGNSPPNPPNQAYTEQEAPTPIAQDPYYAGYPGGGMSPPQASQAHPAEGSFGRKTPRAARPDQLNPQPSYQDNAGYPSYR